MVWVRHSQGQLSPGSPIPRGQGRISGVTLGVEPPCTKSRPLENFIMCDCSVRMDYVIQCCRDGLLSCRRCQVAIRCRLLVRVYHGCRLSAHGGFLCHGVHAGLCCSDELTATQLVKDSDDHLLHRVQYVSGDVLRPLLPDRQTNSYGLFTPSRRFFLVLTQFR